MLLLSSRLVKYDVIALQKTKGRTETIRKTDHNELLNIGPKADGNVGGVGFLINSTIAHLVDSHNIVSPRFAVLRLRAKEKSYYKYVVGDFNAVVGTNCTGDWRLGPHGFGDRAENGELLLNLLYACRLFHGNSMFEKPAKQRWTWESPNGRTHTEIDHVLTNRRWSLLDVSVLLSFDTGSDHRLVRAKIRLNKRIFKRDTHRPAYFKTPSFDTELLESAIEAYDWRLLEDPTEDYEYLTRGLLKCTIFPVVRSQPEFRGKPRFKGNVMRWDMVPRLP
ncbi:unnamed protein product [Haemonchus placei]|uniref:Endo/exonuclease/phosphatase domain-containing protein n=1 Tax=Haemonchus placei TaxID=6290 RepID=A0A0N4WRR2_HAEPC|nr:unnamed protein product [Haemonchus placei]